MRSKGSGLTSTESASCAEWHANAATVDVLPAGMATHATASPATSATRPQTTSPTIDGLPVQYQAVMARAKNPGM